MQTKYVDLRGWACLFDRILSILFTYFENIFLHPSLQFLYVHRVKIRLYVDHADCIKGALPTVEKRLPAPRGNFVLSRTEEFHSGPIRQQGRNIKMVCTAVHLNAESFWW